MYLKSLTLKGFKSFLERTKLSFDPGLSVVVGPNGSGKSNISDAILWVLGEQSAKTLRGQAMEDVIFAGSAQRHAVGVAEVTLVLDNADHGLPLDFAEVAITRRMYRSGESEYLLNGAQVRLRDIRDLLFDMGLGRDTYSIISQGRLGEVLQSRPEERRALIEEAAGVAKHRQRKERAERKLTRLEEDLRRIQDYARLLRRELRPLGRQVDQARALAELTERRGYLETVLAVDDLRALQKEWRGVSQRRSEAEANAELAGWRLAERERELVRVKQLLEQKGLFVGNLEEQRHRSHEVLSGASSALRLLDEKGRHLVDRLSDARRQLQAFEHESRKSGLELRTLEEKLKKAQIELDETKSRLLRLEPKEAEAKERNAQSKKALEAARNRSRCAQRSFDEVVLALSKLSQELETAEVSDRLMADREHELTQTASEAQAALSVQSTALLDLEKRTKELEAEVRSLDVAQKSVEKQLRDARESRLAADSTLAQVEAEMRAFEKLSAEAEEADALQAAIASHDATRENLHRLVDALRVPESFSSAVARYLGDDLFGFWSNDEKEVETLLEEALRSLKIGDLRGHATIFDVTTARATAKDNSTCPFSLNADDKAARALAVRLFDGFVTVEDVAEGRALVGSGKAKGALGADGSVVLADGRIRLGEAAADVDEALSRVRRIAELKADLPHLQKRAEDTAELYARAEKRCEETRTQKNALSLELATLKTERDGASREVGRYREALERSRAELTRLRNDRAHAQSAHRKKRDRFDELTQERQRLDDERGVARSALDDFEEEAKRAQSAFDEVRDALSTARFSALRAEEREASLKNSRDSLKRRSSALGGQIDDVRGSIRALEVLARRVEPLHGLVDQLHGLALAKANLLRDRTSVAEADSVSLKENVAAVEEAVQEARRVERTAAEAIAAAAGDAKVIEIQVEQAMERLRKLDAMDVEEALELSAPKDRVATENELTQVIASIDELGPVNMAALSQFEEGQKKLARIQAELDDLVYARDALGKISRAIDRKMRNTFLETFHRVNHEFSDVFQTLFGGGDAKLEMSDPAHPQETGIEVRAQPPGKRVTKMTLLSGGERSLTALALLFAIYRTRTVPFYVFDEVEQALDDRNLSKLLASLSTLKHQTQLIVISHQRRTMEEADVLYGVSMGGDGVSRAVSQRLTHSGSA